MGEEEREGGHAAEQRVGVQQREQRARVLAVGVDRHAVDDVGPGHAPQQRAAGSCRPRSPTPSARARPAVVLAPELERDAAHDQRDEDQEEREVEAGEERRVPLREGGERGAAGDDQPHLVAVPHRPDRMQHGAALGLVAPDGAHQHPDAEVEALEHEVADPEDRR